jgi:hypothetical protein
MRLHWSSVQLFSRGPKPENRVNPKHKLPIIAVTLIKARVECAYGIWKKWVDECEASPYNSTVFAPAPSSPDPDSFVGLLGGRYASLG